MAQPLSFLFQTVSTSKEHIEALQKAFTPTESSPNILHYAWVVPLPSPPSSQAGWVLLSTVYDENFESYIADLVNANPALFNAAVKQIVGLQNMTLPQDLSQFTAFILKNDLTNGGQAKGFFQAYDATVVQIVAALGD
jgi:hypothetical protein